MEANDSFTSKRDDANTYNIIMHVQICHNTYENRYSLLEASFAVNWEMHYKNIVLQKYSVTNNNLHYMITGAIV